MSDDVADQTQYVVNILCYSKYPSLIKNTILNPSWITLAKSRESTRMLQSYWVIETHTVVVLERGDLKKSSWQEDSGNIYVYLLYM